MAEKGKGVNSISAEEQERLQAVEETVKALKGHSKRDVLCCWRNGLWAVARCTKKLCAAKLPSLAKTLYDIVNLRRFACPFFNPFSLADLISQQNLKVVLSQNLFPLSFLLVSAIVKFGAGH